MSEPQQPTQERASVRFARLVGLPEPSPWTAEQEADYQRWMDDGDTQLEHVIARRRQSAA